MNIIINTSRYSNLILSIIFKIKLNLLIHILIFLFVIDLIKIKIGTDTVDLEYNGEIRLLRM